MIEEFISEGKCLYCNDTFLKKDIARHLKSHLTAQQKSSPSTDLAYHLKVEAEEYFLQLLVKGSADFESLDWFLRDIWVDCCQHMSGFNGKNGEIDMEDALQDVLVPKMKFTYDYDYGTTTTLQLTVAGTFQLEMEEDILLLSRNEPLKIKCSVCKKEPAVVMCRAHNYNIYQHLFCVDCAKKHEEICEDFEEYASMPVVNSPRMGECGYDGGRIDLERDGVYKTQG